MTSMDAFRLRAFILLIGIYMLIGPENFFSGIIEGGVVGLGVIGIIESFKGR